MRSLMLVKKILILTISWSLIFTTTAYAETAAPSGLPEVTESASDSPPAGTQSPGENPDYCAVEQMTAQKCSDGQRYVCHLQECAAEQDAAMYNEEYRDCSVDEDPDGCRDNLKSTHAELKEQEQRLAAASDAPGDDSTATQVVGGVALIYGAIVMATSIELAGTIDSSWSAKWGMGIAAIAVMMAFSQESSAEESFKAVKEMLNSSLGDDGWNVNTQIATLEAEKSALEAVKDAAGTKAKNHEQLATLWTIAAVLAGVEILICAVSWGTKCDGIVGAVMTLGLSGICMDLENSAADESKEKEQEAQNAIAKTQKLIDKLNGLYSMDAKSFAGRQRGGVGAVGGGQRGAGQIAQADLYLGTRDGSADGEKGFCRASGKIVKCPCPDNKCDTVGNNFIPLDSALGQQIYQTGIFENLDKAINEYYAGNPNAINEYATGERSALAKKLRKKLVKKILANKDKLKKKYGNKVDFDLIDNKKLAMKKYGPGLVGLAASVAKFNNGNKKLDGVLKVAKVAYTPQKRVSGVDPMAALKARLAALNNAVGDEEPVESTMGNDTNFNKLALNDKTIKDKEQGEAKIHPDSKVSLFKIISNRYNLMRIKKAFGF